MDKRHLGFVLSYRFPRYIRSTTLREALESNPKLVIEDAVNTSPKFKRYLQTVKKIRSIRKKRNTSLWLVNFRGHDIYWPLRWLVGQKAKIIFDQLISPFDAWVNERKTFPKDSLFARLIYQIEKRILADTDYVITDSQSQAKYYADLFKVPVEKFTVIRGSVDEKMFSPFAAPRKFDFPETFVVFTYGTFIPLQGMDLVLDAAEKLRDLPIRFMIAGGSGKKLAHFLETREKKGLSNISHTPWINFNELPSYIRGAGLCLGGPLGGSIQAKRVITGKALQFLACESPTVVGLTDETRDLFTDRVNCLLVNPGDSASLADTISWAFHNQERLPSIARQGRLTYEKHYSMAVLKERINAFIDTIPSE